MNDTMAFPDHRANYVPGPDFQETKDTKVPLSAVDNPIRSYLTPGTTRTPHRSAYSVASASRPTRLRMSACALEVALPWTGSGGVYSDVPGGHGV